MAFRNGNAAICQCDAIRHSPACESIASHGGLCSDSFTFITAVSTRQAISIHVDISRNGCIIDLKYILLPDSIQINNLTIFRSQILYRMFIIVRNDTICSIICRGCPTCKYMTATGGSKCVFSQCLFIFIVGERLYILRTGSLSRMELNGISICRPVCSNGHIFCGHGCRNFLIPACEGVTGLGGIHNRTNICAIILGNASNCSTASGIEADGVLVDLVVCRQSNRTGNSPLLPRLMQGTLCIFPALKAIASLALCIEQCHSIVVIRHIRCRCCTFIDIGYTILPYRFAVGCLIGCVAGNCYNRRRPSGKFVVKLCRILSAGVGRCSRNCTIFNLSGLQDVIVVIYELDRILISCRAVLSGVSCRTSNCHNRRIPS